MGLGVNYSTDTLLIDPLDEKAFAQRIEDSLIQNAHKLRKITDTTTTARSFRDMIERKRPADPGNPKEVGWTFLINTKDHNRNEIINAVNRLAIHRGMINPTKPLLFNDEPIHKWFDWLNEHYIKQPEKDPPQYILIVGGPDRIPFDFQSFLNTTAKVGRVEFDSIDDLKAYVDKIIRLETADSPVVTNKTIFFAPDAGWSPFTGKDPTYYSRLYMAEPIAQYVYTNCGLNTLPLIGDDATKKKLLELLDTSEAALIYTASHGIAAPSENFEVQKNINGAICCQKTGREKNKEEWLFSADDISIDNNKPFLEGAVFFQFACFGYGTPKESDYNHWLGKEPLLNAKEDFIAALPKRLLSHPRGPVGFIGHLDEAWLHGFDDPTKPDLPDILGKPWNNRIRPFLKAVQYLLEVQPTGFALGDMVKRLSILNELLINRYDLLEKGDIEKTPEFQTKMALDFITRT